MKWELTVVLSGVVVVTGGSEVDVVGSGVEVGLGSLVCVDWATEAVPEGAFDRAT